METAAYFAVAEALTNVIKHAHATKASVLLSRDCDWLTVEVRDNGRGFDPATTPSRGLRGVRDRVETLHGRLTVNSSPTGPTTVRILMPVRSAPS